MTVAIDLMFLFRAALSISVCVLAGVTDDPTIGGWELPIICTLH